MLCDRNKVPLKIGDTVTKDGYLYIIQDIIDWGLIVELACEDKLSLKIKFFKSIEVMKIS